MVRVLLVEDEKIMAKNIHYFLSKEGYKVDVAHDGHQGLNLYRKYDYDLLLLDWTLPKMDGLELCQTIRKESSVPIMMITAKEELIDKVVGLETGADDYVTKPFHQRELLARMKALLRRSKATDQGENDNTLKWNGLLFDKDKLILSYEEQSTTLTATEYKLLDLFMQHPNHVFTREHLFETIWGVSEGYSDRTVDVNISRLRIKIQDLSDMKLLHAIRGMGYRFGDQE